MEVGVKKHLSGIRCGKKICYKLTRLAFNAMQCNDKSRGLPSSLICSNWKTAFSFIMPKLFSIIVQLSWTRNPVGCFDKRTLNLEKKNPPHSFNFSSNVEDQFFFSGFDWSWVECATQSAQFNLILTHTHPHNILSHQPALGARQESRWTTGPGSTRA